ncbi:SGNH/GDSL hydrolase family protein [Salibacterium salarium]|uniref:SGNH/GDSL hydrolase family protein n=1 Tax=Salibacterium salarium TaxID=284579 RepID=UPI0027D86DC8|nr:SGNH/GDSL hydrolase family protein [Salibacterium salarium]
MGDSITEEGRFEDPNDIGDGYVKLIHDFLLVHHPSLQLEIINQGIGGNRVTDLADRWEKDVLDYNPDWVCISIGINDVWRQLDSPDMEQIYPDRFERVYDYILGQVKEKTKASIILMEPTIIEETIQSEGNRRLEPYVEATQRLAKLYDAILIPTNKAFHAYLEVESNVPLTTDGVHMNSKGDMLMASTWIKTISF